MSEGAVGWLRDPERFDGLAVVGRARWAIGEFDTPALLESHVEGVPRLESIEPPFDLRDGVSPAPGRRRLRIGRGTNLTDLDLPIDTPEIRTAPAPPVELTDGAWLLHWPIPVNSWEAFRSARPRLVVLGNARALFASGEPWVSAVGDVRRHLGAGPLLWAPRIALPHRLPFLVYCGLDLLDSTEAIALALDGEFLDPSMGSLPPEFATASRLCPCGPCRSNDRVGHAQWAMRSELERATTFARAGRLRELVESRLVAEPRLAELLRYADRGLGDLFEQRTPVTATSVRTYVGREAFRRPEVARFRDRFLSRYRPPPSRRVLVIVPCSRTKPYRLSRSHRAFARAWDGHPNAARVHVASVTSPLGIVPRELEDLPPARHYDIPVTGDWDEAERAAVVAATRHLVMSSSPDRIVVHLDREEYAFLDEALPDSIETNWTHPGGSSTAPPAIESLRRTVHEALSTQSPVPGGVLTVVKEDLRVLAGLQFGVAAAERLFAPPIRLAGRPWAQQVLDGDHQALATWREERGLFHLTVPGALRIGPEDGLRVEVAPGVPLTGDLFAPGVVEGGPEVREGDAVVLVRAGSVVATGEASRAGPLMRELGRGRAVVVRHRARLSSGSPPATPVPAGPT